MALVSVVALALDVPRASGGWTVAGFVGAAQTQDSSIRLIQPADSTDRSTSLTATGWRLSVGELAGTTTSTLSRMNVNDHVAIDTA